MRNDIVSTKIFADDTKVFEKSSNKLILYTWINIFLYKWSSMWLLKFNETKCKLMHMGRNSPRKDYKIGNVILEKLSNEHDFGIYLLEDIKPSLQCV